VDVVILDLRELDAVTDCFVICTGEVNQQVRAIAESIEKKVKTTTLDRLLHREGTDTLNWVILDYVNVVVHIFKPTFREFYRLEQLWGDAQLILVKDQVPSRPKAQRRATTGVNDDQPSAGRRRRSAEKSLRSRKPRAKTTADSTRSRKTKP
jgi:ribosome-associated protein